MDDTALLQEEILRLKEKKNAILLAHNYQRPEVQDIADLTGDSLELARAAAAMQGDTIVFCGVDFMAETAAILAPDKTVLLPAADACCPMAEMVTAEELRFARARHPGAAVVCYVNTTAGVKAESDICCTSANAISVVNSLTEDRVIFVPDKNLGRYAARFTEKKVLPWEGFCLVHDRYTPDDVARAKDAHPGAAVVVHPECRPEVIDLADHVASTSGIIRYVQTSPGSEFIIGTEIGILHRLSKECPGKRCFPLSDKAVCVNMKKTTLVHVRDALVTGQPRITVPDEIASRARRAIGRMLAL
ncbi:quinolinate synthetase complex, A subunit [Methanoregula boonei 6A8]|jgi:quinolinate synthase|uniref:Quinolinate synthase n=1 Tax=Methanoregula boonei (strain DSM 21154 / JCM 14090 / 6A8) TaxID=456442 RepID=NADA_METB6|nr:quinolinate synthase NadA [Methanoregula boonei]A7IA72.1 RecName: Full=Quinolinate synthase [Methanoregula boonei 6A8]ABS56633.1 quinolinate synthetase complex, A subunit [Methanoregula boonei 6A8]